MRLRKLELVAGVVLVLAVALGLGLTSEDVASWSAPWSAALVPGGRSDPADLASDVLPISSPTSTSAPALMAAAPVPSPSATAVPQQPVTPTLVPTATPERQGTPSTRGGQRPLSMEEEFIERFAADARASQRETGVPASVTLAQAALESDWGRSRLARDAHNYFGIKATAKPGPAGVIRLPTWENLGGRDVTVMDAFRAYHSAQESFTDHGRFFLENGRYAQAMKNIGDARAFARLIHAAGYATDPGYSAKLIRLMDRFDLYRFD